MNFRIVEQHNDGSIRDFDRFVELYKDHSVRVHEIMKELDYNQNHYKKALKKAVEEGLVILRRQHPSKGKNYVKQNYGYMVHKKRNRKLIFNKFTKSEETAKEIVELMRAIDWDVENEEVMARVDELIKQDKIKHSLRKKNYNQVRENVWQIKKRRDGEEIFYAVAKTEKAAKEVATLLKKIDWDMTNQEVVERINHILEEDRRVYYENRSNKRKK